MQFLSIGCGKNVILPCRRNAWHCGAISDRAVQFQLKINAFFIGIGITGKIEAVAAPAHEYLKQGGGALFLRRLDLRPLKIEEARRRTRLFIYQWRSHQFLNSACGSNLPAKFQIKNWDILILGLE
jgi:hypothetical protein